MFFVQLKSETILTRTAAKSKTRIPQPCTPSLEEEKEEKKDYAHVQYGHAAKWLFQGTVPHNIDQGIKFHYFVTFEIRAEEYTNFFHFSTGKLQEHKLSASLMKRIS